MWYILSVVVSVVLFGLVWRFYLSLPVIGPDEVGVKLHWGEPVPEVHYSGKVRLPWIPIKWSGHRPWELVRITRKQVQFRYEGNRHRGKEENKEKHMVWTKDRQLVFIDVTGFIRAPYDEAVSLVLVIRSKVPLDEEKFSPWSEDELIAGLRDIMARFTLEEALANSNLSAIKAGMQEFLLRPEGLFATSGICGNDATSFTPGTGEVVVRIEQINPTEEAQKAMQAPLVARYKAEAAKSTAQEQSMLISGPLRIAMAEWVVSNQKPNETTEKTLARLKKDGSYAQHERMVKDLILAQGGNLEVDRIEVGAPDGSQLQGELGAATAFAGAMAAMLSRGGGRGGQRGGGGRKKRPQDMSDEELTQDVFGDD